MRESAFNSTVDAAQAKVEGDVRSQVNQVTNSYDAVRRSMSGAHVAEVAEAIADPIFRDTVRSMNIPPELASELREQMMVTIRQRCGEISQGKDAEQREMRAREEEKDTKKPSSQTETFDPEAFDPSPSSASPRLKSDSGERLNAPPKKRSFLAA